MDSSGPTRRWWLAVACSILGHGLVGWGGASIGLGTGDGSDFSPGGKPGTTIDVSFVDVPPESEQARIEQAARASAPYQAPDAPIREREPEPIPEPPEYELTLGVDNSSNRTSNWMGFADPSEHSAPKSEVVQPALDPNAGAPGPLAAGAPASLPSPDREPAQSEAEDGGQNSPPSDARPGELTPAGGQAAENADGSLDVAPSPADRRGARPSNYPDESVEADDPRTLPEKLESDFSPDLGLPVGPFRPEGSPDPNAPDQADPGVVGPALLFEIDVPGDDALERPRPASPARATAPPPAPEVLPKPAESSPPASTPPPAGSETPGEQPAPSILSAPPQSGTLVPAISIQTPSPSRPPAPTTNGTGVERAGERSEKESDASSLEDPVQIRPGRPAAAEGLEIITRRPVFSRYTRTVAAPRNPLYRVTFNKQGRVTRVIMIRSSGFTDVDDPVQNAIFQWTARGERLQRLTADAGEFTITIEIILR